MKTRGLYSGVAAIAIAAFLAAVPVRVYAQTAVAIDKNDIGGVVTGAKGPGSRRLGHRGNAGPSDPLRQDGRDRRPGPLRRARSARRQIQGVGARLWPHQFGQGRCPAGPAPESHGGCGVERRRCGAVLSGDLLVLDAENSGQGPVRRQERHSREGHARPSGSPRSRTRPVSAVTSSASWGRGPFRRPSDRSSPAKKRGRGAFSRARARRTW